MGRFERSHPRSPETPGLRDAQLVLAREYGFASWAELRGHVESLPLAEKPPGVADAAGLADRFVDLACLTYALGESPARRTRAERLLETAPEIPAVSLHAAAVVGDLASAQRLLDADPGLATRKGGPRGWDALLYLCYGRVAPARPGWDPVGVARLLLERGADPNSHVVLPGPCRFTALTGALGEGEQGLVFQPPHPQSEALARVLLDAGASPTDDQALYNTHFSRSNSWIELLLSRGLDATRPLNPDRPGISNLDFLLGRAAEQGFIDRVALLLAHGVSATGRDYYNGRLYPENALRHGHPEIAELLVQHGATRVELAPADELHAACLRGDAAAVRRTLEIHPQGLTVHNLMAAASRGRVEVVRLLLDRGLPLDARDSSGLTALHAAVDEGHLPVVEELVGRGASMSIRDHVYGGTATGRAGFFAAAWPSEAKGEVLRFLLDHTPDVVNLARYGRLDRLSALLEREPALAATRTPQGRTPLHALTDATPALEAILELLLQRGADLDARDDDQRTPLDVALATEQEKVTAALRQRGALATAAG